MTCKWNSWRWDTDRYQVAHKYQKVELHPKIVDSRYEAMVSAVKRYTREWPICPNGGTVSLHRNYADNSGLPNGYGLMGLVWWCDCQSESVGDAFEEWEEDDTVELDLSALIPLP